MLYDNLSICLSPPVAYAALFSDHFPRSGLIKLSSLRDGHLPRGAKSCMQITQTTVGTEKKYPIYLLCSLILHILTPATPDLFQSDTHSRVDKWLQAGFVSPSTSINLPCSCQSAKSPKLLLHQLFLTMTTGKSSIPSGSGLATVLARTSLGWSCA